MICWQSHRVKGMDFAPGFRDNGRMSEIPPDMLAETTDSAASDSADLRMVAIILAAGQSSRMGDGPEKQFRRLNGRSVTAHAVSAFCEHPAVTQIIIVCAAERAADLTASLGDLADDPRLKITGGGVRRQDSVLAGLKAADPSAATLVAIHDAARPVLPRAVIDRLLTAMHDGAAAALPVMPVVDTLKAISGTAVDGTAVDGTVDRSGLAAAQTPQVFHLADILSLHQAHDTDTEITDDIQLIEASGRPVITVQGDRRLMKLTTAEDFDILETLIRTAEGSDQMIPDIRVGNGFDVHRFSDGPGPARIGGIDVPSAHSLAAHSDGDVGLHALCDAIFGALGDGDIGTHFPPSDDRWKNADSADFLTFAVQRVAARGAIIQHLDLTLICETPKIGPHRAAMQQRIASLAGLSPERVGVKATTSEKLGFTGRGEGIAAQATATLVFRSLADGGTHGT